MLRPNLAPALLGVVCLLAACHGNASPPAPTPAGPRFAVAVKGIDEVVWLRIDGPSNAVYTVPGGELRADVNGHADGVLLAKDLPAGSFAIDAKWTGGDTGSGSRQLVVGYTAGTPPEEAWFEAWGNELGLVDLGPSPQADCLEGCSGRVTFEDGTADLWVKAPTGCTITAAGDEVAFRRPPTVDARGRLQRMRVRVRVSVTDATDDAKLPDALADGVDAVATLACSGHPAKPLRMHFGGGAVASALRGRYHIAGTTPSGKRANALVVHGALFLDGLDLEHELVRFLGASTTGNDVNLVAKIKEYPQEPRVDCGTFLGERRTLGVEVYDGTTLLGHTTIAAPPPSCPSLATAPLAGDDGDKPIRVARPGHAGVDAFVRGFLRP